MENHAVNGYITEKIMNVYKGAAIPIYWGGDDTAKKYFNPDSFIDINDFASLNDAANYIINLSCDSNKIKKIQSAPIFKNNIVPDIFIERNKPPSKYLIKIANTLRQLYLKEIENNL